MAASTEVCDFSRSFLRWRLDTRLKPVLTVSRPLPMTLNNVRVPLECRTHVAASRGKTTQVVLSASCKTEQVWVKSDIWHQPNADMCMFAGMDRFVVAKRWDRMDKGIFRHPPSLGMQGERQAGDPAEAFAAFSIDVLQRPAVPLANIDEILDAFSSDRMVVAQTRYEQAGCQVLLEYPVKAVNFSPRERFYQVDTGPVLLPEFEGTTLAPLERWSLAYVAHNCPQWAEFIAEVPTPLTEAIRVLHYTQTRRIEGTDNHLFAVL